VTPIFPPNPGFVTIVRKSGWLPERDLARALGQDQSAFRLLRHLLASGTVSRADAIRVWAEGLGVTGIDLRHTLVDHAVLRLLPRPLAEKHQIMLVYRLGDRITAAAVDPTNKAAIAEAERKVGSRLSIVTALPDEIAEAIQLHYPAVDDLIQLESQVQHRARPADDSEKALRADAEASPVVELVETLLGMVVRSGASDLHIEPHETYVQVRLRVDGLLHDHLTLASEVHPRVMSRMKLMAGMNISERRRPQDGRITLALPTGPAEFRASTVPSLYGEKMVLRALVRAGGASIPDLETLDFDADNLAAMRRLVDADAGIVLAAGPTGAGKTTTMFALLKAVDGDHLNILTVEEPIEYVLPRATQVAVNRAIGLGFPELLRAYMRQDPDVMLVGEIRDQETAVVAAEAALTGHLVFATLHASRSLQAMTRLLQLGVPGHLLGPTLLGVVAQRLVQRICPSCRAPYTPSRELLERHFEFEGEPDVQFFRGAGCEQCRGTGFRGRVGVHELVVVNEELRALLIENAPLTRIADAARRGGFRSLRYNGLKKVLRGLTTIEQIEAIGSD
jgi:type IV pilus assembly protein PilB